MARRVDDVATVVASLTRAIGPVLDPTSILARTAAALEPIVPVAALSLWETTRLGPRLVAHHPAASTDPGADADIEAEAAEPGTVELAVDRQGQVPARLLVHPAADEPLSDEDRALLDIAATQIGGALERAQLFTEVMELERLKSDFISRVSHELRTPITIISGFLETLLAHDASLDREQRLHMLERSRVAAARLGTLIEELLILSRLESGVVTPEPEPLTLAELLEVLRPAASEPEQVLVDGAVDHVVVTDRALLTRALGLVVDNAIKYGGVAELGTRLEDGRWLVEVRDRGVGFADDIRTTAFEMFARSQTVSTVPGLGVGLAIARTLIEVLDGSISLHDASPGPGALVRISLPA